MKSIKNIFIKYSWVAVLGLIYFFFSYKLTKIPPGINFDEASIGYNASLISDSLRDENDRLLPVFILTLDGKDWKQPVNVYSAALLFKIFGKSYFNLRLVSVIFAVVSCFLFFKILNLFFSRGLSLVGLFLFFSSPSLLIQSHLVLENIAILPFFLLWLYCLFSYVLKPKNWKLILSGIFLGVDFYAYKGSRALIPIYFTLTFVYLFYLSMLKIKIKLNTIKSRSFLKNFYLILQPMLFFLLGTLPFLLPVRWINIHYAGAIYDPAVISNKFASFYESALIYFSSFDFSFLFIKGDTMLTHSTMRHGIFLAPIAFLFFIGLFQISQEKRNQFYFVLALLALTPFLLMTVGSIYRASRLMVYIPLVTFVAVLGVKKIFLLKAKFLKSILLIIFGLSTIGLYFDFASYYFTSYPKRISQDFSPNFDESFKQFAASIELTGKEAFIDFNDYRSHKGDMQFFEEIYFPDNRPKLWERNVDLFPENGLVLTSVKGTGNIQNIKEIPSVETGQQTYYIIGKN